MAQRSNNEIYALLDGFRKEVFDKIDKVDGRVNELAVKEAVSSTKISMMVAAISIVMSAVTSVITGKTIGKG